MEDNKESGGGTGIDAYRRIMSQAKADSGLLKTTDTKPPAKPEPVEPRIRRVAKFLVLVGSEQATGIMREFDEPLVQELSREIAGIGRIGADEARDILAEFKSLLDRPISSSSGGIDTARRILHGAYGPEKGEALLNKAVPDSKENVFGFLLDFSPEQVVFLLKDENPATTALILARLPPKEAAGVIAKFPMASKKQILLRIARRQEVTPEVLERVAAALRERARTLGNTDEKDLEIDGMQTLAAILKQGDYSFGDRLLGELGTEDPDIGKSLKERLYTMEDIIDVYDRSLAEKLKTMDDRQIAILLKGRSGELRNKILSNVSAGRRLRIAEEGELAGPLSKRECDEVANGFIAWYRNAREKGELALNDDEEWVK